MESPINEFLEDTQGLCKRGRPVEIQVHGLLESGSSDAMVVVQLEDEVQKRDQASGFHICSHSSQAPGSPKEFIAARKAASAPGCCV
jgi:hypothetical protein